MTYNVENLFDTEHDQGKTDYTFLPMSEKKSKKHKKICGGIKVPKWREECLYLDWSKSALNMKMKNTAAAILQANKGKGPDVLILQEIENKNVLTMLVQEHMQAANYNSIVLIEGKDVRGIDVAIVTRLPVVGEPKLHEIPFQQISGEELKDTRGILEAHLELPNQEKLIVYANHFPAPYHKREYRIQAYQYLSLLLKEKGEAVLQIAGGDFNTPGTESRKYNILSDNVAPSWIIANQVAYKGKQGSSYYPKDKTWSFLDMLLLSKNFKDGKGWEWNPNSFVIADKASGQLSSEGFPQGFDPRTGVGMSDHLPLYLELELRKP